MAEKSVYFFGDGKAEGTATMKNLLGGKGANLAEMTNIGIPVPAGFTISTEVCTHYYDNGKNYPPYNFLPEILEQKDARDRKRKSRKKAKI